MNKKLTGDKYIDEKISQNLIYFKNNKENILHLIDTSGKKEKRNLSNVYYKNADCIIMGYDVTNKQSFKEIEDYWFNQIKELRKKKNSIFISK